MDGPKLTATGRVILGMIACGQRTGYDIKQLVDRSTRHFWAASYGQIYPELRRLEEQGLIVGRAEPSGGRARTVYDLTSRGSEALRGWLESDAPLVYEQRDEGILKLFFSDVDPGARLGILRALREQYERQHEQLRTLESKQAQMPLGMALSLDLGLGLTSWLIAWCEETERQLAPETAPLTNAEVN